MTISIVTGRAVAKTIRTILIRIATPARSGRAMLAPTIKGAPVRPNAVIKNTGARTIIANVTGRAGAITISYILNANCPCGSTIDEWGGMRYYYLDNEY